jgi:hypothetical protein
MYVANMGGMLNAVFQWETIEEITNGKNYSSRT